MFKFNRFIYNIIRIMYKSQAWQDLFVEKMTKDKQNGHFLTIGSNHPIFHNTSYLLETKYNWKGLLVDRDSSFEKLYKLHRKSIWTFQDEKTINYKDILDANFPKNMDYLQINLNVADKSTLDTFLLLNDTVFNDYKFSTITLKHDVYTGNHFDTQRITRQILLDRGYVLVFPDVCVFWEGSFKPFEDWYVHPDLIDINLINKVATTKSLTAAKISTILSGVKSVLFLNHKVQNCGVYQYGKRVFDILCKDTDINYVYKMVDCYEEYISVLGKHAFIGIIYNYHTSTMPWLNRNTIQKIIPNIGIPHESPIHLFDKVCDIDPDNKDPTRVSLPRPIFENIDELITEPTVNNDVHEFISKYTDTDIPIFGSFGFGFANKGFDKIVKMVNEQYDNAIIKFVIPLAHFDPDPFTNDKTSKLCYQTNKKEGIILMISHEFFNTTDLLKFLHSNTMNIFLYDKLLGRGISSTIDYALSVKKPLAISDSHMFRHIYSDDICLYKHTIQECIDNKSYLQFLEKYSNENLKNAFKVCLIKKD